LDLVEHVDRVLSCAVSKREARDALGIDVHVAAAQDRLGDFANGELALVWVRVGPVLVDEPLGVVVGGLSLALVQLLIAEAFELAVEVVYSFQVFVLSVITLINNPVSTSSRTATQRRHRPAKGPVDARDLRDERRSV
jgi:hypothetical protein